MREPGHPVTRSRLAAVPAWVAFALACIAGLGYVVGNSTLITFQPGWKAMAPLTALGIAALALPLMLHWPKHGRASRLLATGVCCGALAVLASHAGLHGDVLNPALARLLGIDPALPF